MRNNCAGYKYLCLKCHKKLKGRKTYRSDDSSGSNLKTAAEIIDGENGQIGAESYVDIGSTFRFTLPG